MRLLASRRRAGYEKEIALEAEHGELHVRGRADGYDSAKNQLEEFKTYRGQPRAHAGKSTRPALGAAAHLRRVVVPSTRRCRKSNSRWCISTSPPRQETSILEHYSAAASRPTSGHTASGSLAGRARKRPTASRVTRHSKPCASHFRASTPGQRDLAEAAYKTIRRGGALLAQAPTGIGKTLGTVFPALKAMPGAGLDRLFYLSAKTPGRRLALDALAHINRSSPANPLRVLELVARDKACEHPDKECAGDSCPLARGFYDRLPAARAAAVERGCLDHSTLREIAACTSGLSLLSWAGAHALVGCRHWRL